MVLAVCLGPEIFFIRVSRFIFSKKSVFRRGLYKLPELRGSIRKKVVHLYCSTRLLWAKVRKEFQNKKKACASRLSRTVCSMVGLGLGLALGL